MALPSAKPELTGRRTVKCSKQSKHGKRSKQPRQQAKQTSASKHSSVDQTPTHWFELRALQAQLPMLACLVRTSEAEKHYVQKALEGNQSRLRSFAPKHASADNHHPKPCFQVLPQTVCNCLILLLSKLSSWSFVCDRCFTRALCSSVNRLLRANRTVDTAQRSIPPHKLPALAPAPPQPERLSS